MEIIQLMQGSGNSGYPQFCAYYRISNSDVCKHIKILAGFLKFKHFKHCIKLDHDKCIPVGNE